MKVSVITINDYPAAVMSDKAEAEAFCEARHAAQQKKPGPNQVRWAVYEFEIDDLNSARRVHNSIVGVA